MGSFKKQTIQQIDAMYSRILMFVDLINFDYFFVLKKFDPKFFNTSTNQTPRFEAITGEYIKTDLKDFLDVFLTLDLDADWNKFFDILLQYKGMEVINRASWSRIISVSKGVANSGILNMLVQYLDKNPYWKPSLTVTRAHITELYLRKLKENTEKVIDEVQSAKFSAETDKLYQAVFDNPPTTRLEHYTAEKNEAFSGIPEEYSYIMPLNYMQIFFLDYFNKDIQEMVSLILVRGKWVDAEISRQFSTPYYQLQEIAEQLTKFDASLAKGTETGNNLHRALGRIVAKEVMTFRVVQTLLEDINAQALSVLTEGVRRLVIFGKILKSLIEDYDNKATNEFLINWQEVSMASDPPLKTRMVKEYKRIYH